MNYISDFQHLYINTRSQFKLTGTDASFTYAFPEIDVTKEYDRIVLLSCMIPKTYYLVQQGSNTFTLIEGTSNVIITVPVGNYSRTSFKTVIISLLNQYSPNHYTYDITFTTIQQANDTGFYTYTVTGNGATQPALQFNNNRMAEPFGFAQNSINNFVSNSLISTTITNLQPEATLFIHSDICLNKGNNILQDIPMSDSAPFGYMAYENSIPYERSKVFKSNASNTFMFMLCDEEGNVLDTNGVNIVMSLLLYKSNKISNLLESFIKYTTNSLDQLIAK
jgi:hypothetical protein